MERRGKRRLGAVKADIYGYTLIEMLAAVLILAMVVIITIPQISVLKVKSREESDISYIRQACARYEADYYIDGSAPAIADGTSVLDFVKTMITSEQVNIYYNNDGGFGAMPISIENGYAFITYKPRHANGKKECKWRIKLTNAAFEDEERAPAWVHEPAPVPEPAGD